jgi:hypothetical protein
MGDLQQYSWPAVRAGTRWPSQPGPRHPLTAGAVCVALAIGAWYGLLWRFGQTEEVGATVPRGIASGKAADTRPRREARRVVLAPAPPAPTPSRAPVAPRGSPKLAFCLVSTAPVRVLPRHYYSLSTGPTLKFQEPVGDRGRQPSLSG